MNQLLKTANIVAFLCCNVSTSQACFQESEEFNKEKSVKLSSSLQKMEKEMQPSNLGHYFLGKDFLNSDTIKFGDDEYDWLVSKSYRKLLTEKPELLTKIESAIKYMENAISQRSSEDREKIAGFSLVISGGKDISLQSFLGTNAL